MNDRNFKALIAVILLCLAVACVGLIMNILKFDMPTIKQVYGMCFALIKL